MLSRGGKRYFPGLLALLLTCSLAPPLHAQDAPPLEAEAPPPARLAVPQTLSGKPAPAKPAPAKTIFGGALARPSGGLAAPARQAARGPAVKDDSRRYLRSLDADHDARVSREEYLAGARKRFAKLDVNGDGVISAQEAKAARAKAQERKAKSDVRRLAQGKPQRAKGKGGKPHGPYLSTLDVDKDGRVSRKEFLARRERRFAEIDLNRDGVISREEAKSAKARLLARREERKAEARERSARRRAQAGDGPAALDASSIPSMPLPPPALRAEPQPAQ